MSMSASTTSFSFGSSGLERVAEGVQVDAELGRRDPVVRCGRRVGRRPAVNVTNLSGENASVETKWGTSRLTRRGTSR